VGLAPAQLNSIELVAAAIDNDAGFFSTIADGLGVKAEITYVNAQLAARDTAIASKASTTEVASELATRDTAIGTKSDRTYVDNELDALDGDIAGKVSIAELASQLATRDTAIASRVSATELASELATRDTAIAGRVSAAELTSQLATRDTAIAGRVSAAELASQLATRDTAIAGRVGATELASELATRDTAIAGKTPISTTTALDTRVAGVEQVVTATASYHYLETGTDALVIRGTNEIAANFLGAGAGALEGNALFYKDVTTFGTTTTPTLQTTLVKARNATGIVLTTSGGTTVLQSAENGNLVVPHDITCSGNITAGDLHVQGDLTLNGLDIVNPFWGACQIDSNGNTFSQKGKHNIACNSVNDASSSFRISFPAHPDGNKYVVGLSSNEYHTFYREANSTSLLIYIRQGDNSSGGGSNNFINVTILA
jgi:hypothetical protein